LLNGDAPFQKINNGEKPIMDNFQSNYVHSDALKPEIQSTTVKEMTPEGSLFVTLTFQGEKCCSKTNKTTGYRVTNKAALQTLVTFKEKLETRLYTRDSGFKVEFLTIRETGHTDLNHFHLVLFPLSNTADLSSSAKALFRKGQTTGMETLIRHTWTALPKTGNGRGSVDVKDIVASKGLSEYVSKEISNIDIGNLFTHLETPLSVSKKAYINAELDKVIKRENKNVVKIRQH